MAMYPTYPIGSVGHTLMQMRGTWHDAIELYHLDGSPLNDDTAQGSGTPGGSPFDNLAYIDFDGHKLLLTNVHSSNPERHGMEHLLEWHLIYRDEAQMSSVMSEVGAPIEMYTDKTGVNLFAETLLPDRGQPVSA